MHVESAYCMKSYAIKAVCLLVFTAPLLSCASGDADPATSVSSTSITSDSQGALAPMLPADRDPTADRSNKANAFPPVPAQGVFEEYDKLRAAYTIPADASLAVVNTRHAAMAFGAALRGAVQDPEPSASNVRIPGYDGFVSLPASLNSLGRAAMHQRLGVSGVDVGPSRPDINGKVWVAVFQGASGPIGAVGSVCFAVALFAQYDSVHFEVVEIPSRLSAQPRTVNDWTTVLCELDLLNPPSKDYVYKH